MPTLQVGRQIVARIAESAEIDDPAHTGLARHLAERLGSLAVHRGEVTRGAHGVDEVVRSVHSSQSGLEALGVQAVPGSDLGMLPHAAGQGFWPPRQASDAVAGKLQRGDEPPADVACRSRYQN